MECPQGKHAWMVKIGEKGQFVIPKEARDLFDLHPGETVLVLGDEDKGLAIPAKKVRDEHLTQLFNALDQTKAEGNHE